MILQIGGMEKKSLSVGYGIQFANLLFDIGISFSGGYWLDTNLNTKVK